jgi:predicted RNase H-like HicB family nuclease
MKMPRNSRGRETYKEALANIEIALLWEKYHEDKLTKDEDRSLEQLGRAFCGSVKDNRRT